MPSPDDDERPEPGPTTEDAPDTGDERRAGALVPAGGGDAPARSGAALTAGAAGTAVAEAFGQVGNRVSDLARRAVDKVSDLSPDTRRDEGVDDDLDAPAPMVPSEPLTQDESKLALGIVAAFLVLALVIGIYGLSKMGSNTDFGLEAQPTGSGTLTTSAAPSGSASATESGGTPEPLAILKVEAYDPLGDGAENNNLTPKTYDGDTSTGWNSENYLSDAFGGLKKGLGLIVDLGPNKKPQNVRLVIPKNVDLEVYVGPDADLEGATKIGGKTDTKGTIDFPVPEDVAGQYIIVWYTGLHADDQGKRRAWLNEVVVTG